MIDILNRAETLCQAVVVAGGIGSRLTDVYGDIPKSLLPINGVPVIERQLDRFAETGIEEIVLLLGEGAGQILSYLERRDSPPFIKHVVEPTPLGTGGALALALEGLQETFFFCYGDLVFSTDLDAIRQKFANSGAGLLATVHPNDHLRDSDILVIGKKGRILSLSTPPHRHPLRNRVNAGIYGMDREFIAACMAKIDARQRPIDFEKDVLPLAVQTGQAVGCEMYEYLRDIGTPGRLRRTENDFRLGVPERLSGHGIGACMFVDFEMLFTDDKDRLCLNPECSELLTRVIDSGWRPYAVFRRTERQSRPAAELDFSLSDAEVYVWDYIEVPSEGPWPLEIFEDAQAVPELSAHIDNSSHGYRFSSDGKPFQVTVNALFAHRPGG